MEAASPAITPYRRRLRARPRWRRSTACSRARLALDPIEVRFEALPDRPGDDLRHAVGMARADGRFELGIALARGLDEHGILGRLLVAPFPAVEGRDRRKNVGAGGQSER